MIKLLTFAILISIVWLVPNYKRFESINKIYKNARLYQPAIFTVTNHKESQKVYTRNKINDSYLMGDIYVASKNKTFKDEYFSDNKIYYKGELKRAFPIGSKIKVQFNSLEKPWENGQSMRVQHSRNKISNLQIEKKRERFQRITFGPLVISLFCSFLYLLFCIIRSKKQIVGR